MGTARRIFTYTLTPRDYMAWKSAPKKSSGIYKHIVNQARRRATASGRNIALILAPTGELLEEVAW